MLLIYPLLPALINSVCYSVYLSTITVADYSPDVLAVVIGGGNSFNIVVLPPISTTSSGGLTETESHGITE